MSFSQKLYNVLPYINFIIGSSALCFQIGVLYPWHQQLDDDFEKLKTEQSAKLEQYHRYKLQTLQKISDDLTDLRTRQERPKPPPSKDE